MKRLLVISAALVITTSAFPIGNDEKRFYEPWGNSASSTDDFVKYVEDRLEQSNDFLARIKKVKEDQTQQTINYQYFDFKTAALEVKIKETQNNLAKFKEADPYYAQMYRGKILDNLNELVQIEQRQ